MAGIFCLSLGLRFWGLSRFNTLVFDEVYYAKFASAFLKGEIIFTGHPPLSTYIVAIGIWIGTHLPWGNVDPKNDLAGLLLSPFSYRWLNAFTGAWIPLLVGAIAYQLLHRRTYALIAAFLIALDGLFLVESRYALNNIYLVLLGLLGQLFFLLALQSTAFRRWLYLFLAGVGFGGAAAIKWNGMGFLLGAYGVWAAGWLIHWVQLIRSSFFPKPDATRERRIAKSPLNYLTQLHLAHILFGLVIVPAFTYYVSWLPYIQVDPGNSNFWQLQAETYDYHKRVGGIEAHPYCSPWYSWPLMLRPVAYFYQTAQATGDGSVLPELSPTNNAANIIYDVHAMGNPILWWFSTVAVGLFTLLLLLRLWQSTVSFHSSTPTASEDRLRASVKPLSMAHTWTIAYLLINWAANFLPWVRVTRCVFIYHYMESLVFAVMLLALLIDRWLQSHHQWQKTAAVTVTSLVLGGFIFWMPLFLGLPLSPGALQLRRWLSSWV